jgi:CHAT domain-containing protein
MRKNLIISIILISIPSISIESVTVNALAQTQPSLASDETAKLLDSVKKEYQQGRYAKAIELFEQALIKFRISGNFKNQALCLRGIGVSYQNLEKYREAIDYHQQALNIYRQLKDRKNEGKTYRDLGDLYSRQGKYQTAIDYHQQSLQVFRGLSDLQGESNALRDLGFMAQILGKFPEATKYYQQALDNYRRSNDRIGQGNTYNDMGNLAQVLGNYREAESYFQQALEIYRQQSMQPQQISPLIGLGNVAARSNKDREAIDYYQQTLQLARQLKYQIVESAALNNLGNMSKKARKHQEAIDYYQQALKISRTLGNKANEGDNLANIGIVEYQRRRTSIAIQYLKQASDITDALRLDLSDADKVSLFETQLYYYKILAAAQAIDKDGVGSLISTELGRARIFTELLSRRLSSKSNIPKPNLLNFAQIQAQARSRQATIVSYSILQDYDETMISKPYENLNKILIHIIDPTGKLTVRESSIPKGTDLAGLVLESRKQPNSQQLHRLLIDPIADLLPANPLAPIVFIPDGALYEVPFAALQNERGKYLVESHTISIAPSISVLAQTDQLKQRNNNPNRIALVVGNPSFDRRYTQLVYSKEEAEEIAKLVPSKLLLGRAATGLAVKELLPKARIAHFATHGFMDKERGLNSQIVFTASNGDDGVISAEQLLDFKLQADLVVLSACDTGRGKITGDGVIGLSRSFMAAGASSTIVSLWAVNDRSTAMLMTEFYRQWLGGKPKAQALRAAMLSTKAKYPDPYYWSSMSLYGEID